MQGWAQHRGGLQRPQCQEGERESFSHQAALVAKFRHPAPEDPAGSTAPRAQAGANPPAAPRLRPLPVPCRGATLALPEGGGTRTLQGFGSQHAGAGPGQCGVTRLAMA